MRARHNAWVKEGVPQDSCGICHTIHFAILKLERTGNWKQSNKDTQHLHLLAFYWDLQHCQSQTRWQKSKVTCKEVTELGLEHSNGRFAILCHTSCTLLTSHQHHLGTDQQSTSPQQRTIYFAPAAARANWTYILPVSQTYPSSTHNIWLYTEQSHTQIHLI